MINAANLSKTTLNYAFAGDMELYNNDGVLCIMCADADGHIEASELDYTILPCGGLHYNRSFNEALEDLPLTIKTEKQLREVIAYVKSEFKG